MQDKIKIDLETGLYLDTVHPSLSGEDIIETPCLITYHLPKWNGTEWVEGLSQAEIDLIKNQPQAPTQEEVIEDLIALLVESGVIVNV